jgi:hypothetical protein
MHYGRFAFSTNGQPTIETLNNAAIGQRTGLSQQDIASVKQMYGTSGKAPGSAGGVLAGGQGGPDVTDPNRRNQAATSNYSQTAASLPAPTTSVSTGCPGFGGFDWEQQYVKSQDGKCRDAKLYCTCWRTTASTCGLYLPNGTTNVAGSALVSGEQNCKASCEQVARNGATYVRNNCNRQMVVINAAGRLEIFDYSNAVRDASSDTENL